MKSVASLVICSSIKEGDGSAVSSIIIVALSFLFEFH